MDFRNYTILNVGEEGETGIRMTPRFLAWIFGGALMVSQNKKEIPTERVSFKKKIKILLWFYWAHILPSVYKNIKEQRAIVYR